MSDSDPAHDDAILPSFSDGYGEVMTWTPQPPRFSVLHVLASWLIAAAAVLVAATIVPGVSVGTFGDAIVAAALIAILNTLLPPIVAALRLPFTLGLGFVLVLALDALILILISAISSRTIHVNSFGDALLASLVIAAATILLEAIFGVNDDDTYSLRVIRRIGRRQGVQERTARPGIIFLEIDGLARPVLQRAMRDGTTPVMARWLREDTHRLAEWETDLSSQTGASQAGILLGSNDDVPAFRWVDKRSGRVVACSSPQDCVEIERRLSTGRGLLAPDGASRGNLFSGEAEEVILTVSRLSAEKNANPGYRAFLANGFNVTRTLVLFVWEVMLEIVYAIRQKRHDVVPRGARGGRYPLIRATVCVAVRDLIVFGVLTDMMRGRPAVYATFSSYDEVAHHSGLERADTLEALRKLDQQFGRIDRARRFAPRPYKLVVLSDHGQTQGATFKQRNGYSLHDLVERSLEQGRVSALDAGDEHNTELQHVLTEATGPTAAQIKGGGGRGRGAAGHGGGAGGRGSAADTGVDREGDAAGRDVVVLGSGNLGLVYLMESEDRLSLEEIAARHPRLVPALRDHPHIGFLLVTSTTDGPVAIGARGTAYLASGRVQGEDPLAPFSPHAREHLLRAASFAHAPDILINSFYDDELEQGCAFEELISFHGGMGGPQTRPFILHPVELPMPAEPIVGAVAVHDLLWSWRRMHAADRGSASHAVAPPTRLVGR